MTMIQCPECGHKLSKAAVRCMSCGRPMYLRNAVLAFLALAVMALLLLLIWEMWWKHREPGKPSPPWNLPDNFGHSPQDPDPQGPPHSRPPK